VVGAARRGVRSMHRATRRSEKTKSLDPKIKKALDDEDLKQLTKQEARRGNDTQQNNSTTVHSMPWVPPTLTPATF
jgi:hypothetical protein